MGLMNSLTSAVTDAVNKDYELRMQQINLQRQMLGLPPLPGDPSMQNMGVVNQNPNMAPPPPAQPSLKFCPGCGTALNGERFCGNCGADAGAAALQPAVQQMPVAQQMAPVRNPFDEGPVVNTMTPAQNLASMYVESQIEATKSLAKYWIIGGIVFVLVDLIVVLVVFNM